MIPKRHHVILISNILYPITEEAVCGLRQLRLCETTKYSNHGLLILLKLTHRMDKASHSELKKFNLYSLLPECE